MQFGALRRRTLIYRKDGCPRHGQQQDHDHAGHAEFDRAMVANASKSDVVSRNVGRPRGAQAVPASIFCSRSISGRCGRAQWISRTSSGHCSFSIQLLPIPQILRAHLARMFHNSVVLLSSTSIADSNRSKTQRNTRH